MGRRTAIELGEVRFEVPPAFVGILDHRRQACGFGLEDLDLPIDALAGIDHESRRSSRSPA